MKRALIYMILFSFWACGQEAARDLQPPSYETMALVTPEDDLEAGTLPPVQEGACLGEHTDGYERLMDYIDEHNDEISDRLDMLRALRTATRRVLAREGEVEWTRSSSGRTLTVTALEEDDASVSYAATFEGPNVGIYTFLTGSTAPDGSSGTWTVFRRVGDHDPAIEVRWSRDGNGSVTVERDVVDSSYPSVECANADRRAIYTRDAETGIASLEIVGCRNTASASWDIDSKDGTVQYNDGEEICWDADGDVGQVCEVACGF